MGCRSRTTTLVAKHEAPLDAIPELAHVARPRVRSREREGARVEALARAVLVVQAFQERARQQLDVVAPAPQRRQAHDEYGEPIEQILAQTAVAQDRLGRVIARRDDADVDGDLLGAADAHHAAGFEDAQHLRLQVERHLGDLVEKQRSARRALEIALMLAHGAGEGAALVAEELGLDQVRRDRAAVDGDDGSAGSRAVRVQELRGELLAGPRLADQHHGRLRRRDTAQLGGDVRHLRRFTDQLAVAGNFGGPTSAPTRGSRRVRKGRNRRRRCVRRRCNAGKMNERNVAFLEFVGHGDAPVSATALPSPSQ